jgi:hypothetical protein
MGGVVARMQSDSDPHNTRTPGYFRFCAVQQAACDTFPISCNATLAPI